MSTQIIQRQTTIAPWLTITNAAAAVAFYKAAFGAEETYRLETPDGGLVVTLSVGGAQFWVSGGNAENNETTAQPPFSDAVRMILTVADPDAVFQKALDAGATVIFPVGEDFGWRLGRIADPFGLHWEIGHPLS